MDILLPLVSCLHGQCCAGNGINSQHAQLALAVFWFMAENIVLVFVLNECKSVAFIVSALMTA